MIFCNNCEKCEKSIIFSGVCLKCYNEDEKQKQIEKQKQEEEQEEEYYNKEELYKQQLINEIIETINKNPHKINEILAIMIYEKPTNRIINLYNTLNPRTKIMTPRERLINFINNK